MSFERTELLLNPGGLFHILEQRLSHTDSCEENVCHVVGWNLQVQMCKCLIYSVYCFGQVFYAFSGFLHVLSIIERC